MSAAVLAPDPALLAAVGRHLDLQIESGRRLLDLVLRQGSAIRERDAEAVLARLADIKSEMAAREILEAERGALIGQVAVRLEIAPAEVTLAALRLLMSDAEAHRIETRSAELRGLLAEIAREHGINRALMRQELTFLDHLIHLIGEPAAGGPNRLMDVEA
ncbi:MAG TPA: flagellar export chaperone FlgN [Solirubrobacterales bacterium]